MTDARPANYSRKQLIGHWLVVALVLVQFLLNDPMQNVFHEMVETGEIPVSGSGAAVMHGVGGLLILGIMLWRLSMRLRHGTPPPPESESRPIQMLSRGNHWAFYVVLIAMPIVGLAAVLTRSEFLGTVHSLTSWVLLVLIAAHVAGAAWHMIRGDSAAWQRMLRRDPPTDV